jgi:hypothetical protein
MRRVPAVLAALLLAAPAASQSRPPTLRQVMERVARYVESYGEQLSMVVATEHYSQWFDTTKVDDALITRTLTSEFALVGSQGDWVGFRDVQEVDGRPVRERENRLERLFQDPSAAASAQRRRIADESARYNIGTVQRNINTPTMVLHFLQAKQQQRLSFKKLGQERIDGEVTWRISYRERQTPTIIRNPHGGDVPASGSFWVDPLDGRVFRTELAIETTQAGRRGKLTSTVTVRYGQDARLGLLVPLEMRESHKGTMARPAGVPEAGGEAPMEIGGVATYSNYRRFETSGRVIVPK